MKEKGKDYFTQWEKELAAMRALPPSPIARASGELDALEAALPRFEAGGALETLQKRHRLQAIPFITALPAAEGLSNGRPFASR